MEHGRGVRRDPQSSSIPSPRFDQGIATLSPSSRTGGSCSLNDMMDYPRFQISEMHLGKFTGSLEFLKAEKSILRLKMFAKSAFLHITKHWIKEVEIAKSIDDLLTSQAITGLRHFSDYDMLDAKIASALKKLLTHVRFRRRVSVDFDSRWDQALLTASEIQTAMVLEGSYKSKFQDSVQLQTVYVKRMFDTTNHKITPD